ncbi:MAG: hypothetical protein L0191_14770, partial [Acidobacteria bacterium]|nr:hypothetical protein [Acidobacteriota bacterium]
EMQTARELGEQLLALAQRLQDSDLLLAAHDVMGDTLLWLGEFRAAREHLERGIALYDTQRHRSHAFLHGYDSGVACLSFVAPTLWHLGYPDQASKRIQEGLALARELSHPASLALALGWAAWVHQLRREGQAAQGWAEECVALATDQGIQIWLGLGTIFLGWALDETGRVEEGIAHLRQGLAGYRAAGSELMRPWGLALLAATLQGMGRVQDGLGMVTEALDVVQKTEERFHEAELYRLKGKLALARLGASEAEAEACFRQAVEIARRQQAKSLELRAVMSLSRLLQKRGKKDEARRMLAEVYNWFTEGFDTRDLKEAKELLEAMS